MFPSRESFDPSNPLGFLEEALDFVDKQSNFLKKDTAEKEIVAVLQAVIKKSKQESLEKLLEVFKLTKETAKSSFPMEEDENSHSRNYGDVTLKELQSRPDFKEGKWREAIGGNKLTKLRDLVVEMAGSEVLIRGRVHTIRAVSTKLLFLILRQSGEFTVQCVAKKSELGVTMTKFLEQLPRESLVEVIGVVSLPKSPLTGTTQQVEIQVRKVYCISRSLPKLPLNIEDASRSEADCIQTGLPGVNQDIRLNNRVLDLRTPANQAIFRLSYQAQHALEEFYLSLDFFGIHTPKLNGGSSEGGSAVFKLDYNGQPACLAQSPQLHKQMAICGDCAGVFVLGPVFRAEKSDTHRHLCEFTGFDMEMEIHNSYYEVMDIVSESILFMLRKMEMCKKEIEAIRKQYPSQPLEFGSETLRLTYAEGIRMLQEAGEKVDPLGDLTTELERKLGQLVKTKYNTDLYILHRFPLAVRPFYTMPCADDPRYSNSFDVFLRGEEIISGGQRIHDPELLEKRARECNLDVKTISPYIDSFRYGAPPHGGFGMGLERMVMLFCGLDNIRKTSMFPRDPHRLTP